MLRVRIMVIGCELWLVLWVMGYGLWVRVRVSIRVVSYG